MEFSFPLVRAFPVVLLVHVSLVVPWLVMVIETVAISVVWADSMVIKVRVVLSLEVLWHKAVMKHIVVIVLPVVVIVVPKPVVVVLILMVFMMDLVFLMLAKMFPMVLSVRSMLEMKLFVLFFVEMVVHMVISMVVSVVAVRILVPCGMCPSVPLVVSPVAVPVVVRVRWVVYWLSFFWSPVNISITMVVIVLMIIRFHFQHKVSTVNKCLRGSENGAIVVEGGIVTLVPPACVEGVEIIFPVELKSVGVEVVGVGLNIVEDAVPWHVNWVEPVSPGFESWGPEVHHQRLPLVHVSDSWVVACDSSNLVAINAPSNEVRMPDHLVDVPVVEGIEVVGVVVRFVLLLSVTVDCVHGEWAVHDGRHNLNI